MFIFEVDCLRAFPSRCPLTFRQTGVVCFRQTPHPAKAGQHASTAAVTSQRAAGRDAQNPYKGGTVDQETCARKPALQMLWFGMRERLAAAEPCNANWCSSSQTDLNR